jgi:hypothetical protein
VQIVGAEKDGKMMTIESVLESNPFKSDILDEWRQMLSAFDNGSIGFNDLDFSIEEDKDAIKGTRQERITRWQILPHPYLGDPHAKIWMLNINPGFCVMDYFDCLTVDRIRDIASHENNFTGGEYTEKDGKVFCFIHDDLIECKEEKSNHKKRRAAILSQLRFENNSFSYLDNCFKHVGADRNRAAYGGYEWWRRIMFGRRGSDDNVPKNNFIGNIRRGGSIHEWASRNVFNLEFFPYHSTSFDSNALDINRWRDSAYYKFWFNLLQLAIQDEDRIFIVRSPEKFDCLLNGLKEDKGKLKMPHGYLILRNRQNPWLTMANIECSGLSVEELYSANAIWNHAADLEFYRNWFARFRE